MHDFEGADNFAERIRALDELEYLYLKGEILICKNQVNEADKLFRQYYQDVSPDEHTDYVYDVANLYSEYNLYDMAFEWLARSQGDNSDDFKELVARTLFGLGKYEDSSRLFNELLDQNPYSKRYWNALASAQFMNEDYSGAVTSSEYAIAIDPDDPESILAKANGLYSLENYKEALNYFERYTDKVCYDEFGYLHQGSCLINLGDMDEAIARLEEAERVAPQDSIYLPEIYQELAFAYSEKKLPETALYYIDKTKDLECDHTDMEVFKGHILMANNRIKDSEQAFKAAIQHSDNPPQTILRIMVSLYDNRYVAMSYALFKKFFSYLDNDWKDGYSYMALCCWDLKKYDELLHYISLATEKNPKEAHRVLGHLFPDDLKPKDYVEYLKERLNKR